MCQTSTVTRRNLSLVREATCRRTPLRLILATNIQPDVSGLPRVFEALNMIMWPSMIRTPHGGLRRNVSISESADDSDPDTFEHSFATVSETAPPHHPSLFDIGPGPSSQSLVELNAWLDNEDSWTGSANDDTHLTSSEGTLSEMHVKITGFEDDFTDFLSAPPIGDIDTDLPSPADIQTAAERIFGPQSHDAPDGFDLTSVLGSLEAMREEISGITDMEERRKAAARVALGLAMGLGLDGSDEDEPDEDLLRELHQM